MNDLDARIRPGSLAEYVNQEQIKGSLVTSIASAKQRGKPLDHVLLSGPPGLGKTTLAGAIAHDLGGRLINTSGAAITKPGDMAAIVASLQAFDCLFIDEIHRLPRPAEEMLYPAMEDNRLDIILPGTEGESKVIRLQLQPFTLIGATTRPGLISAPLRDRFGHQHRLEYYSPLHLCKIIMRTAGILGSSLEPAAAEQIALRARGTPRIANRLLARAFDEATVNHAGAITLEAATTALDALEIDARGLNRLDRAVLRALIEKYAGGPVGLDTLAASVSEDPATLSDTCEPFLLSLGMIARGGRGRTALPAAYEHLGLPMPKK